MGAVVIPAWEGLAGLAAATVSALGISSLLDNVDAKPRTKDRDCAETPDETECKKCDLTNGLLGQAREPRYINAKTMVNYRYQLYIANLHAAPEHFCFTKYRDAANEEVNVAWERVKEFFSRQEVSLTTTEWLYRGIWFDGFWRRYCTVVEAKGNYDWLFPPPPRTRPFFAQRVIDEWAASFSDQEGAIESARPRARLEWHFMQSTSWHEAITNAFIPTLVAKYSPPPWNGL